MTIDINALFSVSTAVDLFNSALDLAQAVGLPVTSWRASDPTRAEFTFLARMLAAKDPIVASFIRSAFLSTAEDDWKTVVASETYGIDRVLAENSTPSVVLHNGGGGLFTWDAGDLTLSASSTGATFHNTNVAPVTLAAGQTSTPIPLVADVEGSAGTVTANEIDTLVTTALGVTVVSSTAAIGLDEQDDDSLQAECDASRGALSPSGPPDAYEYVATNAALTMVNTITRARSTSDATDGTVTVYVAGPDGTADSPSVAAVQAATEIWANPLCNTPTVVSAVADVIAVTATISGADIPPDYLAQMTDSLGKLFALLPIANEDGGTFARSKIYAAFEKTLTLSVGVNVSAPAADVTYVQGHVPKLGTLTITVV